MNQRKIVLLGTSCFAAAASINSGLVKGSQSCEFVHVSRNDQLEMKLSFKVAGIAESKVHNLKRRLENLNLPDSLQRSSEIAAIVTVNECGRLSCRASLVATTVLGCYTYLGT